MGKLPDRWLEYDPIGKRIPGTRFICFKVPLKETICSQLVVDHRFTPEMMRQRCPNVKLVVDLTNTGRYYNGQVEFSNLGIMYKKILTPGHVIPPSHFVTEFFKAVDSFVSSSADDDESLIGVHCTHGLNRTSYFVVSYMINKLGFDPREAMNAFEEARGHKIERKNYIDDLLNRGMGSTSAMHRPIYRDASKRPRTRRSRWDKSVDVEPSAHTHRVRSDVRGPPDVRIPPNEPYPPRNQTSFPNHRQNYQARDNYSAHPSSFHPHSRGFPPTYSIRPPSLGHRSDSQWNPADLPNTSVMPPAMTYAEHRARRGRYNWTPNSEPSNQQPENWRSKASDSNASSSSHHIQRSNLDWRKTNNTSHRGRSGPAPY